MTQEKRQDQIQYLVVIVESRKKISAWRLYHIHGVDGIPTAQEVHLTRFSYYLCAVIAQLYSDSVLLWNAKSLLGQLPMFSEIDGIRFLATKNVHDRSPDRRRPFRSPENSSSLLATITDNINIRRPELQFMLGHGND